MSFVCAARTIVAAFLLALPGQMALAVPIVVQDDPRVAVEIQNLDILGTLYNVTFNNVVDGTFVGNAAGAIAARDAINAALNTSTADLVRILSTGVTVNNFGVMDTSSTTVRGVSFSVANNWQPLADTSLLAPIAQFVLAPAQVPLPAGLPLLGTALIGFLALRRRA